MGIASTFRAAPFLGAQTSHLNVQSSSFESHRNKWTHYHQLVATLLWQPLFQVMLVMYSSIHTNSGDGRAFAVHPEERKEWLGQRRLRGGGVRGDGVIEHAVNISPPQLPSTLEAEAARAAAAAAAIDAVSTDGAPSKQQAPPGNTTTTTNPTNLLGATSLSEKKKRKKDEISFSNLEYTEVIGEGAFGKVYRAQLWGQEVAVKELRLKEGSGDAVIKEFKKEVKIMRTLRHPNVVEFLGACVMPPNLCIVTEYLTNGSMEDVIGNMEKKGKHFSFPRILSLAKDISRGLNWLHHKGVIHRDLKTANILLDANGRAKIADFGLAHVKRRTGDPTGGFYGVCGTPCYMAPEVLNKEPYGVKADVFSFAIVLCEIVLGKYPYENEPESTATFEQAIVSGLRPDLPPPHLCPPSLSALIDRCWSESPDDRPSMYEVVTILSEIEREYKMTQSAHQKIESLPEEFQQLFEENFKKQEELHLQMTNQARELSKAQRTIRKLQKQVDNQKAALERSQLKLRAKNVEVVSLKKDLNQKQVVAPDRAGSAKKGSEDGKKRKQGDEKATDPKSNKETKRVKWATTSKEVKPGKGNAREAGAGGKGKLREKVGDPKSAANKPHINSKQSTKEKGETKKDMQQHKNDTGACRIQAARKRPPTSPAGGPILANFKRGRRTPAPSSPSPSPSPSRSSNSSPSSPHSQSDKPGVEKRAAERAMRVAQRNAVKEEVLSTAAPARRILITGPDQVEEESRKGEECEGVKKEEWKGPPPCHQYDLRTGPTSPELTPCSPASPTSGRKMRKIMVSDSERSLSDAASYGSQEEVPGSPLIAASSKGRTRAGGDETALVSFDSEDNSSPQIPTTVAGKEEGEEIESLRG